MIKVTRLNGSEFYLNSDLIESLESTPDTVVTLTSKDKWVVQEPPEELVERIKSYRREIHSERPKLL